MWEGATSLNAQQEFWGVKLGPGWCAYSDKSRESASVCSMCRTVDYRKNRIQFYTRFLWKTLLKNSVVQQNKWIALSCMESGGIILCSFIHLLLFSLLHCLMWTISTFVIYFNVDTDTRFVNTKMCFAPVSYISEKRDVWQKKATEGLQVNWQHHWNTLFTRWRWRCIIILSCRCWWVRKEHYCKANEVSTPFKDKLLFSLISLVFKAAALLSVTVKPVRKGQKG